MAKIMNRLGVSSRQSRNTQKRPDWPPAQQNGYVMKIGMDGKQYAVDNFGRTFLMETGEEVFNDVGEMHIGDNEVLEGTGIGPRGEILHFFPSQQMKILKGKQGVLISKISSRTRSLTRFTFVNYYTTIQK
jgi:hypothetical protein